MESHESNKKDNTDQDNLSEELQTVPVIGTIYYMRDRSKKIERHSAKPLRENRRVVNYSEMDIDEDAPSPKRPEKKPRVSLTGPSVDRINAQNIIILTPGTPKPVVSPEQDRLKKRFFRKDLLKVKPAHRKTALTVKNEDQKENLDDQQQPQTEPNDEDKNNENKNNQQKTNVDGDVKPKGVFNTTKHSLVKHKTV